MNQKLIYKPLTEINSRQDANFIFENGNFEDLMLLSLSIGMQCPESEKHFAQELCIRLAGNTNAAIRANAITGLAYIARKHKWLNKRIVKPYILRELRENIEFKEQIKDSIKKINLYLGWQLNRKGK